MPLVERSIYHHSGAGGGGQPQEAVTEEQSASVDHEGPLEAPDTPPPGNSPEHKRQSGVEPTAETTVSTESLPHFNNNDNEVGGHDVRERELLAERMGDIVEQVQGRISQSWEGLKSSTMLIVSDKRREEWLETLIETRRREGKISQEEANILENQAGLHYIRSIVRDIEVVTATEALTIVGVGAAALGYLAATGNVNEATAIFVGANASPLSPAGIIRMVWFPSAMIVETVVTSCDAWKEREDEPRIEKIRGALEAVWEHKGVFGAYGLASLISPVKGLGFFAPAIIAAKAPEMSSFLIDYLEEKLGHTVDKTIGLSGKFQIPNSEVVVAAPGTVVGPLPKHYLEWLGRQSVKVLAEMARVVVKVGKKADQALTG